METLVSGPEYTGDYYHNTQEHGPIWSLLNQMLHIIVLVYTVFGLIRFKVKFIRMVKLVKWISFVAVFLSMYTSVKFAIFATIFYLFSMDMASRRLTLIQFNCSLAQYETVIMMTIKSNMTSEHHHHQYSTSSILLANLLQHIGGPYRLLGNRAALMYGFFSISIYIMLALFPVEHYYLDIGFNYIRFVLNDSSCLRDCYAKKEKHIERLCNWSRNMYSSMITFSMKHVTNRRDLRSSYLYERFFSRALHMLRHQVTVEPINCRMLRDSDSEESVSDSNLEGEKVEASKLNWYDETYKLLFANRLAVRAAPPERKRDLAGEHARWKAKLSQDNGMSQNAEEKLNAPVKSLRHTLSTNHSNEPSYNVKVANENLKKFKPFVRSERWFKISMVIYPIFIFFYFISITIVLDIITISLSNSLETINDLCLSSLQEGRSHEEAGFDLFANWSLWDQLTYLEGKYSVFALSCASSFYCSYYFGTILELWVWVEEILQQLNLSRVIIDLIEVRPPPISLIGGHTDLRPTSGARQEADETGTTSIELTNPILDSLFSYHDSVKNPHLIGRNFNQFGGLNSIVALYKLKMAPQSERLRKYELIAIRLVIKRQTVLRSTYINLNMFLDELNDTRFMTTTILRRTAQIAFGFALMLSITRSQFETSVIWLSGLLLSCLAILNLYLICAAFINSGINKLLPQIHALISVFIMAGSDNDLLEFWLRHIQAYGLDKDAMSYKIYGYKVTWSTILNFNTAVSSAYLLTVC